MQATINKKKCLSASMTFSCEIQSGIAIHRFVRVRQSTNFLVRIEIDTQTFKLTY